MNDRGCRQIALDVIERIRSAFPNLKFEVQDDDPHLEVNIDIPPQQGLDFKVNINLQNEDELHIVAGKLWVQWFPIDDPRVAEQFYDSVCGLLSGEWRIVEHYRRGHPVKAQLQQPVGDRWQTKATWSCLHLPIPWTSTKRVLKNGV